MRSQLSDERHLARSLSAGGLQAGAGLSAFPVTVYTTGRARHFQLALCMRLGMPLPELLPVDGVAVRCGCEAADHDEFGFHPGVCRSGNRLSLWTQRHDAVEQMLVYVLRRLGVRAQVCSHGSGSWFGAAGLSPSGGFRRADVVLPHRYGPGRHLFLDVAVTDPATGAALGATPSSAVSSGVAASQRAEKKTAKYAPLATAISSYFTPAVLERFGACCSELVGLIRMLCGDGDRDEARVDDYVFSGRSRVTYVAQHLVFATMMADAAMVEHVISVDVARAARERWDAAAARGVAERPGQREVEGLGGQFWYERPHARP